MERYLADFVVVFRNKSVNADLVRNVLPRINAKDVRRGQVRIVTTRDQEDVRELLEDGLHVEILEIDEPDDMNLKNM